MCYVYEFTHVSQINKIGISMTIILFLVDTSASMNQRTYLGTSLIDVAKASVEIFMKIRARDSNSRWDRYMLLTFEDPPANVKAGWKESASTFTAELKNLRACGITNMGQSIKHAFDLLNVNRMQSGIDTYGQLNLPMISVVPGSELTKEPFRWDQRIFSLVLRLPGSVPPDALSFPSIPQAESQIDVMCEVTGGRSYEVYSQKMVNAALESLVQKAHCGVVINFEKIGPDPQPIVDENQDNNRQVRPVESVIEGEKAGMPTNVLPLSPSSQPSSTGWHSCRRLIYVPRSASKQSVGHWPIPEAYWPDANSPSLPPRTAHPIVRFSCQMCEPMLVEHIPFDKYEMEPSPLTQYILEMRKPNYCWQIFVGNSSRSSDQQIPFGYLKASSSLTTVNMFIMPYNYPVLLPLLGELSRNKMKPTQQWRERFNRYSKSMPGYYGGPLKRALHRMGAVNILPENLETCLSYSVITYLKKLKNQAKVELDRMIASVGQLPPAKEGIAVQPRTRKKKLQRHAFSKLLENAESEVSRIKQELVTDFSHFHIPVVDPSVRPQCFGNAFDISRDNLLDQITRMRSNLLRTSHSAQLFADQDERHAVPVQQMGNYQEELRRRQSDALRAIDSQPARLHMFGNPFKVNKQSLMVVDEAEDAIAFGSPNQACKRKADSSVLPGGPGFCKRKPGPLPRGVSYHVLSSPRSSPPSSPTALCNDSDSNTFDDEESPLVIVIEETSSEDEANSEDGDSVGNSSSPRTFDMRSSSATRTRQSQSMSRTDCVNHPHETNSKQLDMLSNGLISDDMTTAGGAASTSDIHQAENRTSSTACVTQDSSCRWDAFRFNCALRIKVCKEVKRPGKDFTRLFQLLSSVQGSVDARCSFVHGIVHEALRFKRNWLVTLLNDFKESLCRDSKSDNISVPS